MAKQENDTQVAEITGDVVSKARSLTADFHRFMLSRAEDAGTDSQDRGQEIMEAQAMAILTAEGTDAILNADLLGTVQCRDVPGTFWELTGFDVLKGNREDIENSHGYYVQFHATCIGGDAKIMASNGLKVGTSYPLQTSALLLTTKARALEADGAYPIQLALIGNKTGSGNTVLKWGPMPVTVMQGSAA
jgi:hypothetical protein